MAVIKSPHRRKVPDEWKGLSNTELAGRLKEGTGIAVFHAEPYWDVVGRLADNGRLEWIVTDSSVPDKPLRVHGPVSRAEAESWAAMESRLFLSLRGGLIEP